MKTTEIELHKEDMKFSAGHFTIFSSTEREDLHGHNFRVYAKLKLVIGNNGMAADYGPIKKMLRQICNSLDEKFIIPKLSPHIKISEKNPYTLIHFNGEEIPFLPRDILILDIVNSSLEEFSRYIAEKIISDKTTCSAIGLKELTVKVSSGPGQWASYNIVT